MIRGNLLEEASKRRYEDKDKRRGPTELELA
jgi:hypothetical protein